MKFNTIHLHAPLVCGFVENKAKFGVDGVARCERLVEFKLTDDVTQRGLSEFFNRIGQIFNLIDSLHGVHNLKIEQCVDFQIHIILGNHVLTREIINRLSDVDTRTVDKTHVLSAVVFSHIAPFHRARLVDNRPDDVDARRQLPVEFSQTFNDHRFRLFDDLEAGHRENQDEQCYYK